MVPLISILVITVVGQSFMSKSASSDAFGSPPQYMPSMLIHRSSTYETTQHLSHLVQCYQILLQLLDTPELQFSTN